MNKKVIKTMIWLVIGELIAWYILKIFFPEQFILVINNENFITIGNYIDRYLWLSLVFVFVTAFITDWLYLCAVCKKPRLSLLECFIILINIGLSLFVQYMLPNFLTLYLYASMFGLPLLFKADFKTTFIVFVTHSFAQTLSMNVRGLDNVLIYNSFTIGVLMSLECYFWLFLFYLYYNYKEIMKKEE